MKRKGLNWSRFYLFPFIEPEIVVKTQPIIIPYSARIYYYLLLFLQEFIMTYVVH